MEFWVLAVKLIVVQLPHPPPPNAAGVGTDKKQRDKEIGGIGSHIDPTKPLSGTWKWAAVLGGGGILTHVEMRR